MYYLITGQYSIFKPSKFNDFWVQIAEKRENKKKDLDKSNDGHLN